MSVGTALDHPACGCGPTGSAARLVSVDRALAAGLALATQVRGTELVPLARASGRVLAHPVLAAAMMPPFDNSAMDGYALRTADLAGPGPWRLPVSGRIAAGAAGADGLAPGTAARIFTGAPVPAGADAVVMQERAVRDGDAIVLEQRPAPGENIRRRGEDIAAGAIVLPEGQLMGLRQIAAAAAAGAGQVSLRRRLRVALLVTGDEIRPAGAPLEGGQVWDVNGPMLAEALAMPRVDLCSAETVPDHAEALAARLADLRGGTDLVVTTGGVSVGEEDHTRAALRLAGGVVAVSGVAIKPGKPVTIGRLGGALFLGLPGNPVSALITWKVLGAPLVSALSGEGGRGARRRQVISAGQIVPAAGRCEFRPAKITGRDAQGREVVDAARPVHSGRLAPLLEADGLVLIPPGDAGIDAGDLLEFLPFCEGE